MTTASLHQTVAQAWRQILGQRAAEPDATWDRSGGDSLKVLQLFLTLENQLGRKLDPALLGLEMTANDLADAIGRCRKEDDRPAIFLFPGIGGYDAQLAEFRRQLTGDFHFTTIAYPGLDSPLDIISSKRAIVDFILEQIRTQSSARQLDFAAYSFGGAVAITVAGELQKRGYEIRSMIAIDCVMDEENPLARESVWLSRGIWGKASWRVAYGLFRLVVALRIFQPSRRFMHMLRRVRGRHDPFIADWISLFPFRARARGPKMRNSASLPVTLLRARTQINPDATSDLGWGRYVDTLNVISISGDHRSCLEPPNLIGTCEAFARAFFAFATPSDQPPGVTGDAMD